MRLRSLALALALALHCTNVPEWSEGAYSLELREDGGDFAWRDFRTTNTTATTIMMMTTTTAIAEW